MNGFARLLEMTQSLSKEEVNVLNEISKGDMPRNLNNRTLYHFSFILKQLSMLKEDSLDNPLYKGLEEKLKVSWKKKFGKDTSLGKILDHYNDPNSAQLDNNRFDFDTRYAHFDFHLEHLTKTFDSVAVKWLFLELRSADKLGAPLDEIVRYIKGELGCSSLTLKHIFEAISLNQYARSECMNLNQLICILSDLPTASAKQISDALSSEDIATINSNITRLSRREQEYLLSLYPHAKAMNVVQNCEKGLHDGKWPILDSLRRYLPHRGKEYGTSIDENIISKLPLLFNSSLYGSLHKREAYFSEGTVISKEAFESPEV